MAKASVWLLVFPQSKPGLGAPAVPLWASDFRSLESSHQAPYSYHLVPFAPLHEPRPTPTQEDEHAGMRLCHIRGMFVGC